MNFDDWRKAYQSVRRASVALAEPLSPEDCCVQAVDFASPTKWNLAHTSWFFETFLLERWESPFQPFDTAFRVLFNSYYNGVGNKHPRPQRGLLTRPTLERVLEYRADIDRRLLALPDAAFGDREFIDLLELGLNHEQQHQELLLTDQKYLFSCNPLAPAYHKVPVSVASAPPLSWKEFVGGVVEIGHAGTGFAFDNEGPRHRVYLSPFRLASRLVTNAEFKSFIEAGGYDDPTLWLSEGWDWRGSQGRSHPLYWRREGSNWKEFTLAGLLDLDPAKPVVHVGYFEAEAYARWTGSRLPTEAEWEHAVEGVPVVGHFADSGLYHPKTAESGAMVQLYGDAWVWTSSSYEPYPGFRIQPGAVGEYNGKFMVNQYVLRGGSCATPAGHIRSTYRNFFPTWACWQFSGIRLAGDL